VDVTIVRLATVTLALVTSGAGVLAYILLWVLVPEEPVEGSNTMSDTTNVPAPEPPAQPEPPVPPAPAPYAAPQPVTGHQGEREARNGGIMGGVILIVLGGIFLASQFVPGIDIVKLWPLILIAIGVGIILRRR
jgi:hypothetical protein